MKILDSHSLLWSNLETKQDVEREAKRPTNTIMIQRKVWHKHWDDNDPKRKEQKVMWE